MCRAMKSVSVCVAVVTLCGCAGSQGRIVNPISPDTSFVKVDREFNVYVEGGDLISMTTKGERGQRIIPRGYSIHAASPDGEFIVLGNSDTDLFLYTRGQDTPPREIVEVRGRASGVAISPDRSRVAVSLHPDYSKPTKSGPEFTDDAIYIVDVASGQVEVVPASRKGWVMALAWSEPGAIVMHWRRPDESADEGVRLDLKSGERSPVEWGGGLVGYSTWRSVPVECGGVRLGQDDLGLYVGASEQPEYIVSIEGRKRGFHDHFETISSYQFIGDCDHVLFVHDAKVYIHQRSSGSTASLGPGRELWAFAGKSSDTVK